MKKWKDLTLYEKGKKIAKYTLNVLTIINALIIGINGVEGIAIPYYTQITFQDFPAHGNLNADTDEQLSFQLRHRMHL